MIIVPADIQTFQIFFRKTYSCSNNSVGLRLDYVFKGLSVVSLSVDERKKVLNFLCSVNNSYAEKQRDKTRKAEFILDRKRFFIALSHVCVFWGHER